VQREAFCDALCTKIVLSRGKALEEGLGEEVPQKLKLFAHILTPHGQKLGVFGHHIHQQIDATAAGLGAVPPAGSRGKTHVQGVWGEAPRS